MKDHNKNPKSRVCFLITNYLSCFYLLKPLSAGGGPALINGYRAFTDAQLQGLN